MKLKFRLFLVFLLLCALGVSVLMNYGYFFAKKVVGEISDVKQIEMNGVLMTNAIVPANQKWSFAVAIRDGDTGDIFTSSTEDRQWAVAKTGQCVIADLYPYPPWDLQKEGTYHNARLRYLCDTCEVGECKIERDKRKKSAPAKS